MGRGAVRFAAPARLRPLAPMLVAPDHDGIPNSQLYWGWRWAWYQALRFLVLWAALYLDARAFGLWHAAVTGALAGLAFRFDYWSNCVELLAACLVCSAGVLGIPLWGCVAGGVVLGLGRETLPLLALVGGVPAFAVAAGSAATSGAVRLLTRTAPQHAWATKEMQHGWSQRRYNATILFRPPCVAVYWEVAVYVGLAVLASVQAPLLTVALVALTFWRARIDEPRVLTMLAPWAATTLVGPWR